MDKFREKLIKQRNIYIGMAIMSVIFMILSIIYNGSDFNQMHLKGMDGARVGACGGELGVSIIYIIQITNYLKNDEKLKKQYIKQSDERARDIREKSFSASLNIFIIIAAIGMFISSFFNPYVSITLWTTIMIIIVTYGLSFLYYSKKY